MRGKGSVEVQFSFELQMKSALLFVSLSKTCYVHIWSYHSHGDLSTKVQPKPENNHSINNS